jgi:hypothetical protein
MDCSENWGTDRDRQEDGRLRRENITIFVQMNCNNITKTPLKCP